jgi:cytochrome c556
MKFLVLILVGLLVGAMGATVVVNTMRQRDAYARGLMDVMQHHYAGLRESLRARRCDASASAHAIAQMRAVGADIDTAIYPDATPDAPFREYSARLTAALDAAAAASPVDCNALAPHVQVIGKVCDECHQQYR